MNRTGGPVRFGPVHRFHQPGPVRFGSQILTVHANFQIFSCSIKTPCWYLFFRKNFGFEKMVLITTPLLGIFFLKRWLGLRKNFHFKTLTRSATDLIISKMLSMYVKEFSIYKNFDLVCKWVFNFRNVDWNAEGISDLRRLTRFSRLPFCVRIH